MSNTQKTLLAIVAIIIIVLVIIFALHTPPSSPVGTATTTPATIPGGWVMATSTSGLSFAYPPTLSTGYIATTATDWPPQINLSQYPYSCTAAERTVNGHTYCVTTESQGAAGSIYNLYAYAFVNQGKTLIFTFSLRYPQCANYPDPNKTSCTNEESSFNVDSLVDQMAQTIR